MKANVTGEQEKKAAPRPLILELNEAKAELVQSVNNALRIRGIPCYLMEPILSDVLAQIREGARNELAAAQAEADKKEKSEEVTK